MKNRWTKIILSVLFLAALFLTAEIAKSPKSDQFELYFLNVGQGDAILIQKGDCQTLVDGGPDDKVLSEIGKLMPISDRKIESMILSHPHADHLVGLNEVLDRYEVSQIYGSGILYTSNQYLEFLSKIKDKNINFAVPAAGEKVKICGSEASLTFLWPGDQYKNQSIENLNNSSLVVKFCEGTSCAILTGDAEKPEQDEMIAYYTQKGILSDLGSDILKVPHHGSSNAAGEFFFQTVSPKTAVIEAGADNQFGHPHAVTLDLLNKLNIKIFRTDRDGTIKFRANDAGFVRD